MRIGNRVIVEICDDFTGGCAQSGVAGRTEAAIFGPDNAYVIFTSNLACPIGRPVVNNNDLKIGVTKLSETLQALSDRAASIKSANHNGDARRTQARGERYFAKSLADHFQRGLGRTFAVGDSEIPVFNISAAVIPFIRPGIDTHSSTTHRERGPYLPIECSSLCCLAVPAAV